MVNPFGPAWFVPFIPQVAILMSGVTMLFFSDFINRRIVFPLSDAVRTKTKYKISKNPTHWFEVTAAKYLSESAATLVFLAWIFFASYVLAEFIYEPILLRMESVSLVIFIIFFLIVSFVINEKEFRMAFMKV